MMWCPSTGAFTTLDSAGPATGAVGPACDDGGMTTLSDFTATTLSGQERNLSDYAGQVVLVVNTASACGFAAP
jgi:hypothetical protein